MGGPLFLAFLQQGVERFPGFPALRIADQRGQVIGFRGVAPGNHVGFDKSSLVRG
jgi:hypothetical protein